MNPARPLLFLTFRTVFNGLKRALTTPRRLISLLVFLGYYFLIFIRPALSSNRPGMKLPPGTTQFDFPPLQVIDALSFGLFAVMSLFLLMGALSANATFKPADVDILFSTPISPRVVLTFRMVRDYLITLLIPLAIAIFGLQPARLGWEAVFRNMPNPEYSGMTLRFIVISWLLMSLCWVMLNYALSLWVNRNDAAADRRKLIAGWTLGTVVVLVFAYIGYRFWQVHSPADAMAIAADPILRVVFFTATFANQMTLAPFTPGGPLTGMLGAAGLLAVIALGYWLALRQVGWMYDQAAVRAAAVRSATEFQRSGDMAALMAQRVREGKVKTPRMAFVGKLRMTKWRALIWKEMILQPRTTLAMIVMFVLIGVLMSVMATFPDSRRPNQVPGYVFLAMQGMVVFMISMAISQTGFIEVLRRVDLQKPLPFPSWVTVASEVGSKTMVTVLATLAGSLAVLPIKPGLWPFVLGAVVGMPGFAFLLSACVFFVTMLFPDVDDPSQRSLRGLLMMLAVVVCGAFPATAVIGLLVVGAHPVLATLVGALIAFGIGLALAGVSARLYESFNPQD